MAEPSADGLDADALLGLVNALQGSGSAWASALAAGGALIFALHRFGLLAWLTRTKTEVQAESFQERMLAALTASHKREDMLLEKLTAAAERTDALRDEVHRNRVETHENRFETHMLRQQIKLFLTGLQQVRAGVIPLDALPDPDLGVPQ